MVKCVNGSRFACTSFNVSELQVALLHRVPNISYCIFALEFAPTTGRKHIQAYFELYEEARFRKLRDCLTGYHLENARFTRTANINYVKKDGLFSEFYYNRAGLIVDKDLWFKDQFKKVAPIKSRDVEGGRGEMIPISPSLPDPSLVSFADAKQALIDAGEYASFELEDNPPLLECQDTDIDILKKIGYM